MKSGKERENVEKIPERAAEVADSEDDTTSADESPSPIEETEEQEDGTEIIILDNMTDIINELFARKEKGDGTSPSHSSCYICY